MNKKQRIVLIIGLFLFAVTALFPAYAGVVQTEGDNYKYYLGHYCVLIPPSDIVVNNLFSGVTIVESFSSTSYRDRIRYAIFGAEPNHRNAFGVETQPIGGLESLLWDPTVHAPVTKPPESDFPLIFTHILLTETLLELIGIVSLTFMLMILLMDSKQVVKIKTLS